MSETRLKFYCIAFLLISLCVLSAQILVAAETPPSKKTTTYKTVGNCAIHADVYRVSDAKNLPVILWIHGGALIFGNRGGINPEQLDRYLHEGFIVVAIDYRLAPETKLPGILEDLQDAYTWIRKKGPELFGADPNRIAVIGHSAGGYLTLTSGFRLRPRPKALVSFYGYGDIAGPWYSRPDPFYSREPPVFKDQAYACVGKTPISESYREENRFPFYLYCRQQGLWPKEVVGYDPEVEPRAFDPFCPVRNVSKEYPPTLQLHGDKDTDVPFEQMGQMVEELKKNGVVNEAIPITGGGHGFDHDMKNPRNIQAFDRVIAFLKRWV